MTPEHIILPQILEWLTRGCRKMLPLGPMVDYLPNIIAYIITLTLSQRKILRSNSEKLQNEAENMKKHFRKKSDFLKNGQYLSHILFKFIYFSWELQGSSKALSLRALKCGKVICRCCLHKGAGSWWPLLPYIIRYEVSHFGSWSWSKIEYTRIIWGSITGGSILVKQQITLTQYWRLKSITRSEERRVGKEC